MIRRWDRVFALVTFVAWVLMFAVVGKAVLALGRRHGLPF